MAAQLEGEIVDLNTRVERDSKVKFFDFSHPEGRRTYLRSLLFVLSYAVEKTFPGRRLKVLYSLGEGLICEIEGVNISPEQLEQIEEEMRNTIKEDLPFIREVIDWEEATAIYQKRGRKDLVKLFRYWRTPAVTVYRLQDFYDHYYGPLVPSTGYLKTLALSWFLLNS